jgi:hypothetical protein
MTPEGERLDEPVHVLGAPELLDSRPLGGAEVAFDVPRGERLLLARTVVVVLPQMKVVIGEHGRPRLAIPVRPPSLI